MTNQQGAPEALFYADALDRCAEVDFDHIFVPAAAVIRRLHAENERLAALVEAQQPAAHVQNPAEIEHVAGDVSKNRPESNMAQQPAPSAAAAQQSAACDKAPAGWLCIRQHGHDGPCAAEPTLSTRSDDWVEGYAAGVRDGRSDALRAPQPSPTPQADSVLEDAARYRHLREADPDTGPAVAVVVFNDWGNVHRNYPTGDELDAVIDAARKQGGKP